MRGQTRAAREVSRARAFAGTAGLAATVLSTAPAHAAQPLRFDYDRTPEATSCGDGLRVRAKIAERLGRDPFVAAGADPQQGERSLRVRMGRSKQAFVAEIVFVETSGRALGNRTLTEATSCEPLVASVAFTVAVLLEDLSSPPAAPVVDPWPDSPASRPEFDRPPLAPTPIAPRQRRFVPDAALGAVGSIGTAPAPALGFQATIGADIDRFRVELGGRADFPASSTEGDVGVRTRLVAGRVAPCYGLAVVSGCFVFAAGTLSGEAIGGGVDRSRIGSAFYSAGGAGVLSRIFIGEGFFVRAAAEVTVPFSRVGFDVGERRVWTLSSVAAAGTLGLGVRLP